jgi:hypothetical protein
MSACVWWWHACVITVQGMQAIIIGRIMASVLSIYPMF